MTSLDVNNEVEERFQEELRKQERERWGLEHSLMINEETKIKMKPYLNNFKSPKLQLCYKEVNRPGFSYKIWFIKDSQSDWVISFNEEADGKYLVKVHEYKEVLTEYRIFDRKEEIMDRMLQVLGATNYSMLLRNSEHIAWYIKARVWVSHQICEEFSLLKRILRPDKHAENLSMEPPKELEKTATRDFVFHDDSYDNECVQNAVMNEILSEAKMPFRVIVIGPTGAGKSTMINHLYNRKVCGVGDSAKRETDKVESTHDIYSYTENKKFFGQVKNFPFLSKYKSKKVNIFDTIGLCDGEITDSENIDIVKNYLEPKFPHLDKVVVVFSVKSTNKNHIEAMKACLYALNYSDNKENFLFVLSRCDLHNQDEDEKKETLKKMINQITDGNMPSTKKLDDQTMVLSNLNQKLLSLDLRTNLRRL